MNNKVVIGIVVAVLIVFALWNGFGGQKAEAPNLEEAAQESGNGTVVDSSSNSSLKEALSGSGSFLDLMGMNRDLSCEFSQVSPNSDGAVVGEVKISGDKIRTDFEIQQADGVLVSHMIEADGYVYTWSESSQGQFAMKMVADESDSSDDPESVDYGRSADLSNDVDYKCHPWGLDQSVFTPPSDIEFTDMEEIMGGMMQDFDPGLLDI